MSKRELVYNAFVEVGKRDLRSYAEGAEKHMEKILKKKFIREGGYSKKEHVAILEAVNKAEFAGRLSIKI